MNTLNLALIISLASLGFRAITGKGMIFYFMRKPFDNLNRWKTKFQSADDTTPRKEYKFIGKCRTDKWVMRLEAGWGENPDKPASIVLYLAKPVIICSTCMASVHTLIWFPIITGEFYTANLILVMLIVAILNTLIWSLVELIQGK